MDRVPCRWYGNRRPVTGRMLVQNILRPILYCLYNPATSGDRRLIALHSVLPVVSPSFLFSPSLQRRAGVTYCIIRQVADAVAVMTVVSGLEMLYCLSMAA